MIISILVDDPNSWIVEWAVRLQEELSTLGHDCCVVHEQDSIRPGEIAFFLGCIRIVAERNMGKCQSNIVVHPSDLPRGRGFSPLAWQILDGRNEIPFCLFEATPGVDEGPVYLRDVAHLGPGDLNEEIKDKQGAKTLEMCLRYVREFGAIPPVPQVGEPTYYAKRTANDSELDVDVPLRELFPLLRVVDNSRYPAYFYLHGEKYIVRIEKAAPESEGAAESRRE